MLVVAMIVGEVFVDLACGILLVLECIVLFGERGRAGNHDRLSPVVTSYM